LRAALAMVGLLTVVRRRHYGTIGQRRIGFQVCADAIS
jgi:hypothetical protein